MAAQSLSFKQACELLKAHTTDSELIENLDHLLSLTIVLAAIAFGPVTPLSAAAIGFLGFKNEATKVAKWVAKRLLSRKNLKDVESRQDHLVAAHVVITYASFFEVLAERLDDVGSKLNIDFDRVALVADTATTTTTDTCYATNTDPIVNVPHPAEEFVIHLERLREVYGALAKAAERIVVATDAWVQVDEPSREKILAALAPQIIEAAVKRYKARYADLAIRFPEFYIWASLNHSQHALTGVTKLSREVRAAISLLQPQKTIDLGFARLEKLVDSIPAAIERRARDLVLEQLQNGYEAAIDQPIIKDAPPSAPGLPELRFPTAEQIFVPQSFKVIRYVGGIRLEDPTTWAKVPVREDLGLFLTSFLSSPHSESNPLVILGQPGSGKSLLTKVMAARLGRKSHTVLRIELRDVKADIEIPSQIEEQIRLTISRDVSWASVTEEFEAVPGLVILDGYDELLQASGKVHSGYLLKVRNFQQNELAVRRRSVRAIVTSRVTLIDKAVIPKDCTVVKLEEFDTRRQEKWASVWNQHNEAYFRETKFARFTIPSDSPAVAELARQPLLLLMLALYDSEKNPLRDGKNLDRTALYDSLIRRFVTREKDKSETFRGLPAPKRESIVDRELERLGVPAIGMFNRRSLSILESQLNSDLAFFEALPEPAATAEDRELSAAALLLGSFFFVHESKAGTKKSGGGEANDADVAFEFLHNTFGEFLAADFLLRRLVSECRKLNAYRNTPELAQELTRKLASTDGLSAAWFGGLVYTPLFSRPVVLQMMREWLPERLRAARLAVSAFAAELSALIDSQIAIVLDGRRVPSVVLNRGADVVSDMPLLGHLAVYTVNLITLAAVLSDDGYRYTESRVESRLGAARSWDRLSSLWRSWFSIDNLFGVSEAFRAERVGDGVCIRYESEPNRSAQNRLGAIQALGYALADPIVDGLAQFAISLAEIDIRGTERAEAQLMSERVDISLAATVARLYALRYSRVLDLRDIARRVFREYERDDEYQLVPLLVELIKHAREEGDYELMEETFYRFRRSILSPRSRREHVFMLVLAAEIGEEDLIYETLRPEIVSGLPSNTLATIAAVVAVMGGGARLEAVREEIFQRLVRHETPVLLMAALRVSYVTGGALLREVVHRVLSHRHPEAAALFIVDVIGYLSRLDSSRFGIRRRSDRMNRDLLELDKRVVDELISFLSSEPAMRRVYDTVQHFMGRYQAAALDPMVARMFPDLVPTPEPARRVPQRQRKSVT